VSINGDSGFAVPAEVIDLSDQDFWYPPLPQTMEKDLFIHTIVRPFDIKANDAEHLAISPRIPDSFLQYRKCLHGRSSLLCAEMVVRQQVVRFS
jgi:hypothetical protein